MTTDHGSASPPPEPEKRVAPTFSLREVSVRHDGAPLAGTAELHSRDRFDIVVDVDRSAYVYVIRVAPGKKISVLYPTATAAPQTGTARIPADPRQIFQLDDQVGEEHLYVVAISESMSDSAAAVADAVEELEGDGPTETVPAVAVTPIDAGVPEAVTPPDAGVRRPSRKKATTRVSLRPVDDKDRDVVVVSTEGTVTCANVVPNARGVAACRFTIRHVP